MFMREQYRGVDYLDFWLDVVQHLSLCRHYIRGLRQSILASPEFDRGSERASSLLLEQLLQDGVLDDSDSHRLSAFLRGEDVSTAGTINRLSNLLDAMNAKEQGIADLHSPSSRSENFVNRVAQYEEEHGNGHNGVRASMPSEYSSYHESRMFHGPVDHLHQYYEGQHDEDGYEKSSANSNNMINNNNKNKFGAPGGQSTSAMYGEALSHHTDYNGENQVFHYTSSNATDPLTHQYSKLPNNSHGTSGGGSSGSSDPTRSRLTPNGSGPRNNIETSSKSSSTISQLFPRRDNDIADGSQFVTRHDIRQSAQRLLVTYFIVGAERELPLPQHIVKHVKYCIEVEGRDDPEVFDEAREYTFQAMERDAFPSFLAAKALGNVSPSESLIRLIVGLFSFFAAFWVAFILIFLDWSPKVTRLWLILPFGVGAYGVFSSLYNLDPLMALAGFSEASSRKVVRIREPYVRQLLIKRAFYVLAVIVLVAAIFVIIFALVPGRRL